MSGIQNIQVGSECPIEAQLADGAVDQYPQAKVYNENSSLLITINLSHRHLGNYNGTSYSMPNTEYIKVAYVVYSDAGHTVENTGYERVMDIFYRLVASDYKATVSALALEATAQQIRKAATNREKMAANRLTRYEDDAVTPREEFDLFDENGVPTMRNVTERRPV